MVTAESVTVLALAGTAVCSYNRTRHMSNEFLKPTAFVCGVMLLVSTFAGWPALVVAGGVAIAMTGLAWIEARCQ